MNSKSLSEQSNVPNEIIKNLMNDTEGMEEQSINIALRIAKALNFTLEDMLIELVDRGYPSYIKRNNKPECYLQMENKKIDYKLVFYELIYFVNKLKVF